MASTAKFRIDVAIHDLLMNSTQRSPAPVEARGLTLPEPVFPQFPERINNPGPEAPPEKRKWGVKDVYRYSRGWLGPYVRSRVLPGEFHPSPLICLSNTSATSIAGIAGRTTTKSRA
jgi:hypothetical protein